VCRHFERAISADEAREARRCVSQKHTEVGTVRITAELLPEEAAVVMKALEAATRANFRDDVSAETPSRRASSKDPEVHVSAEGSAGARRADALVQVAEQYLAGGPAREAGSPYQVVVRVGAGGAELEDGTPLSAATAARI